MADHEHHDAESEELEPWPWDDEGIDEDLVSLADAPSRDSILRPILMILVLVLGGYIISDWQEELAFFFSPSEPINIGTVQDYPSQAEQDASWSPDIPHNRVIQVSGIPSKRSIANRYKYFKLVGGEVYIEERRDDYGDSAIKRELADKPTVSVDRTYFIGEVGRAVSFASMPGRYAGLRRYYEVNYGTKFCVDMEPSERERLKLKQRETIRTALRQSYELTSEEERVKNALTPEPTEEQITAFASSRPVCVDSWLIQIGVMPSDYWWYVALTTLFAIFMLIDAVFLVRWVIAFVKPDDGI